MQLSTGFIIAGAYADKIKKTMFAQLREAVSKGELESREIARAAAELNQLLYRVIVDELKSDKGDVVRARVDYDIVNGRVVFKLDTLKLEYFKRVPDEEVAKAVEKALAEFEKEAALRGAFEVEKVASTALGDQVFKVLFEGREVGMVAATPLDGEAAVRGALLEPKPTVIKGKLPVAEGLEEALSQGMASLLSTGREASSEEAGKVIEDLKALASAG